MRRTTVFLDLGPIHPHPLTARPRGRIYSPPAGDHNSLHRLYSASSPSKGTHKDYKSTVSSSHHLFFPFLFFSSDEDELSWPQFHLTGKCYFPGFGALLEEMIWERKVWSICIYFLFETYVFFFFWWEMWWSVYGVGLWAIYTCPAPLFCTYYFARIKAIRNEERRYFFFIFEAE